MSPTPDWHSRISSQFQLPSYVAQQLNDVGFVVLPGRDAESDGTNVSQAYDRAVAAADTGDVHIGKTGSSIRIDDFVNRGPAFDSIYIYPPLLAACSQVIGAPFKLSGMRGRTLNPGAAAESLHVDVKNEADGSPLVGCILMIDDFNVDNGATRFVPGSHLLSRDQKQSSAEHLVSFENEVIACGPAGSMIIFNGSAWHGHGANRSGKPRRSIQLHFVPREAAMMANSHVSRMRAETLHRISDLGKYVLDVG